MKILTLILVCLLTVSSGHSQCYNTNKKVMVLGDSWAAFSWEYDSYSINFDKFGLTDVEAYSTGAGVSAGNADQELSQSGTEARNYLTQDKKDAIAIAFSQYPEIEFVHISLAGNDFLGDWDTTWTTSQIDAFSIPVIDSILSIVSYIESVKPDVTFLMSGYDYPNFEESINDFFIPNQHPFYARWNSMLQPSFAQINGMLRYVHAKVDSVSNQFPNMYFVDNAGLMQYRFGQTYNLPVAPGGSFPPMSVPFPGGDSTYPSPLVSMNSYPGFKDAFHLSPLGYEYFVENQTKEFYFEKLRDYDATVSAIALGSGSINENLVLSDSLFIGNVNDEENSGYLTFVLPTLDATKEIDHLSIFLKRKAKIGMSPIGSVPVNVGISRGSLGDGYSLDVNDYQTIFIENHVACEVGSVAQNDYWYRLDLGPFQFANYQSNDTLQIQINFSGLGDSANQAIQFYLNENNESQPFLDVHYGQLVSIENQQLSLSIKLSPNPTDGYTFLDFQQRFSGMLKIYDISGKIVLSEQIVNQQNYKLDGSKFSKGLYILKATSKDNDTFESKLIIR